MPTVFGRRAEGAKVFLGLFLPVAFLAHPVTCSWNEYLFPAFPTSAAAPEEATLGLVSCSIAGLVISGFLTLFLRYVLAPARPSITARQGTAGWWQADTTQHPNQTPLWQHVQHLERQQQQACEEIHDWLRTISVINFKLAAMQQGTGVQQNATNAEPRWLAQPHLQLTHLVTVVQQQVGSIQRQLQDTNTRNLELEREKEQLRQQLRQAELQAQQQLQQAEMQAQQHAETATQLRNELRAITNQMNGVQEENMRLQTERDQLQQQLQQQQAAHTQRESESAEQHRQAVDAVRQEAERHIEQVQQQLETAAAEIREQMQTIITQLEQQLADEQLARRRQQEVMESLLNDRSRYLL